MKRVVDPEYIGTSYVFPRIEYATIGLRSILHLRELLTSALMVLSWVASPTNCSAQFTYSTPPRLMIPSGFYLQRGDSLFVGPGGLVGGNLFAHGGTEINITGGTVLGNLRTHGAANISGGVVGSGFTAALSSDVSVTGGRFGPYFRALSDGSVSISGGSLGPEFRTEIGSNVELVGGEFRLNGLDYNPEVITLEADDVLAGTFADGSTFVFSPLVFDRLLGVTLTEVQLPMLDLSPKEVTSPQVGGPYGLRPGQMLTVRAGGALEDSFAVVDSTMHVEAGSVGRYLEAVDSVVNISGGTVGNGFQALSGSEVNISGGTVNWEFHAHAGSEVNISGGLVGYEFAARSGSEVNISGGEIGHFSWTEAGSEVNISGGEFGDYFSVSGIVNICGGEFGTDFGAYGNAEVNLFGGEFEIDGVPLDSLEPGAAFTITQRNVTLSGLLADGSEFSFDLNPEFVTDGEDVFQHSATLTVTLVAALDGDFNNDGAVDAVDYALWRENLGQPAGTLANDPHDSVIGQAQYDTWRANFGASLGTGGVALVSGGVPEPMAFALGMLWMLPFAGRRCRRG